MSYAGNIETDELTHKVGSTLFGSCTTLGSEAAKAVSLEDFDALLDGVTVQVKFLYSNTAANPTLNVNNTGAKPIYVRGVESPGTTAATSWDANSVVSFTYDGANWMMNDANVALTEITGDGVLTGFTATNLTGAANELKNTLTNLIPILPGSTNNLGYTLNVGDYFEASGVLYEVITAIPNTEAWAGKASALTETVVNDLKKSLLQVGDQVQLLVVSDTDTTTVRNLAQSVDNFKLITIEFLNSGGALFASHAIPTAVFKTHSGGYNPIVLYVYDGSGFHTAYIKYISSTTVYAAVGTSGYVLTIRGIK